MEQEIFKDAERFNYGAFIKKYLTTPLVLPDLKESSHAYYALLGHKGMDRTALIVENVQVRNSIVRSIPYNEWPEEGLRIATIEEFFQDYMTFKEMTIIFEPTLMYKFLDYFDTLASLAHKQRDEFKERISILEAALGLARSAAQAVRDESRKEDLEQIKMLEKQNRHLLTSFNSQKSRANYCDAELEEYEKLLDHPLMKFAQEVVECVVLSKKIKSLLKHKLHSWRFKYLLTKMKLRNAWRGW
jgi:hypothetical protein